jgi:hypothetical protein
VETDARSALHAAVMRLLRPLVRILLNHGVPFDTFQEIARWVYVEVADKDFELPGRKQTDSRISVITGLTRKDVARIRKVEKPEDRAAALSYNRAARVVKTTAKGGGMAQVGVEFTSMRPEQKAAIQLFVQLLIQGTEAGDD